MAVPLAAVTVPVTFIAFVELAPTPYPLAPPVTFPITVVIPLVFITPSAPVPAPPIMFPVTDNVFDVLIPLLVLPTPPATVNAPVVEFVELVPPHKLVILML